MTRQMDMRPRMWADETEDVPRGDMANRLGTFRGKKTQTGTSMTAWK